MFLDFWLYVFPVLMAACESWNFLVCILVAAFWNWHLILILIHFIHAICSILGLEPSILHATCSIWKLKPSICNILDLKPSIFACYLQHFGAASFHFDNYACYLQHFWVGTLDEISYVACICKLLLVVGCGFLSVASLVAVAVAVVIGGGVSWRSFVKPRR